MTGASDPDRERDGDDRTSRSDDRTSRDDDHELWPVVDTEVVWDHEYFTAGYDVLEGPDGERTNYYWIDANDIAVVVPITDDGQIVLIEEYSNQLRGTTIGCPAGRCEDGEAPAETAARELEEETGYRAGSLGRLGTFRPEGWVRMEAHVFTATDLAAGDTDLEPTEDITVWEVPSEAAVSTVLDADIVHGSQVMPLLFALDAGLL